MVKCKYKFKLYFIKGISIIISLTFVNIMPICPAYLAVPGSNLSSFPEFEQLVIDDNGNINYTLLKPYGDYFEDYNMLLIPMLIKAMEMSRSYKELTFEFTLLLLSTMSEGIQEFSLDKALYCAVDDVHHFDRYRELMTVIGMGLVIGSRFEIKTAAKWDRIVDYPDEYFNDLARNRNRLRGFFRDQTTAEVFVEMFKKHLVDTDKPYLIDEQISLLDALEGIEFEDESIYTQIHDELEHLYNSENMSDFVKARLKQVLDSMRLISDTENSAYINEYDKLAAEFKKYMQGKTISDIKLFAVIDSYRNKGPKITKAHTKKGLIYLKVFKVFKTPDGRTFPLYTPYGDYRPFVLFGPECKEMFGDIGYRGDPVDQADIHIDKKRILKLVTEGLAKVHIYYNACLDIFLNGSPESCGKISVVDENKNVVIAM